MATQKGPSPLPPTIILKNERISQSAAHDFLTAYLERAASDPGFQPDSTLSAQGPITATAGSATNLVIHNLKRVQAGLAGEVLGRDMIYAKLENEGDGIEGGAFRLQSHAATDGQNWPGNKPADKNVDGWQDLQSYEREQTDLVQVGDDGAEDGVVEVTDYDQVPEYEPELDKEERKRRKKMRRKEEQRNKNMGNQDGD
ncbi:hypothetical protein FQN57_000956 [Myotisia sp. PD_48]|nr:hypothetical protein FQN57_000956 [Myotisia sp. PD_48]